MSVFKKLYSWKTTDTKITGNTCIPKTKTLLLQDILRCNCNYIGGQLKANLKIYCHKMYMNMVKLFRNGQISNSCKNLQNSNKELLRTVDLCFWEKHFPEISKFLKWDHAAYL